MAKLRYKEVSKGNIKQNRNVVISQAYDQDGVFRGYSVSEQAMVDEGDKQRGVFLRGGLGIVNGEGLVSLYEALKTACVQEDLIGGE